MKKVVIIFLVNCFVMYAECLGKSSVDANSINAVVTGNNDFTLELYRKLKDDSKGNLFFSPYSISTALIMAFGGARGQTQKEMAATLRITLPSERLYPAFGALQKQLIQKDNSIGYQLLLANALWKQKGKPFLKEFLDLTQSYYDAGLNQLDFVNETEKSRQTINHWVEEKTNDKIKDLIPPDGVNRDTALVLTNAVYFKGQWKTKFSWWKTQKADFAISAKDKVRVPLMHIKEDFRYYEDEKLQALEMPYKSNEISMLVLLPQETEGLKELENTIQPEKLDKIMSKMQAIKIEVFFPRFKMALEAFSVNKELIALGMSDAFDSQKADFSGVVRKDEQIWISNVYHKAFIEVNEEGTEAAASTGGVMTQAAHIDPIFRADHPFLFIIRDNRSGSILFMGRLTNPAAEE